MKGIIFSGAMVRALLAGRKTQTRRLIKNLRVDLPNEVSSDLPFDRFSAKPGRYRARLNAGGAVTITTDDGELGVKPGEFHFACPYASGRTVLADFGGGRWRSRWMIVTHPSRLWVRERISLDDVLVGDRGRDQAIYESDRSIVPYLDRWPWKVKRLSPIFMPWGCRRIELDVRAVRAERLQDISEEDAVAEGLTDYESQDGIENTAREMYAHLWDEVNGAGSWNLNPFVWVLDFSVEFRKEG